MRRKLFCVSGAMVLGIWTAGEWIGISVLALLLGSAYAAVLHLKPESDVLKVKTLVVVCVLAILAGSVRMILQQSLYDDAVSLAANDEYIAEVIKVDQKRDAVPKLTVRITDNRKCLVSYNGSKFEGDLWRLTGCIIEFRGKLEEPDSAGNPRCFDYRTYLRSKGICLVSSTKALQVVRQNGSIMGVIRRRIIAFREGFLTSLKAVSSDEMTTISDAESTRSETGAINNSNGSSNEDVEVSLNDRIDALLRGVLFGDTDSMDEDMKDDFRSNGTAHVLAVSGLHVGMLYSVFRMLRKKIAMPGMTVAFIAVLMVYGTMTLWTPSVTRAAALIVMMEIGERLDRPFDMLTSLGSVSMLALMWNPYSLYSTSFIMSYLAALSIGVIVPVLKQHLPDRLSDSIKTSLAVQIGLVPYIAYSFNTIALGALIINIPVVAVMSIIVTVAVTAVPVYILAGVTAGLADRVVQLPFIIRLVMSKLAELLIIINEKFSDIEILSPDVISPPVFLLLTYYGILFLICSESFRIARLRKDVRLIAPQIITISAVVLAGCIVSWSALDGADIIMVDVGQGDCMHFRFSKCLEIGDGTNRTGGSGRISPALRIPLPGHTDVMIDGGGTDSYNVGKNTLKPYLLKNGTAKLDLALVTHLHTDHYKGIQELADEKMVRQVITEGRTGDVIRIGSTGDDRIEIIWPDERDPDTDDENKNSLIFKVYIGGVKVLITGDIGEEGEHALVERYMGTDVLDCDILKVCHHGSRYSSSDEFLDAVSPAVAVIGVGKNNTYGHPADEVIERMESRGISVFRTDRDGAVGMRMTRSGLKIFTNRHFFRTSSSEQV